MSWRQNGRKLNVVWQEPWDASAGQQQAQRPRPQAQPPQPGQGPKFLAAQLSASEFVLTLTRPQPRDNQSVFTCLLHRDSLEAAATSGLEDNRGELLHESNEARLRVAARARPNQSDGSSVKIDVNMAPPIDDLANSRRPHQLANGTDDLSSPVAPEVAANAGPRRVNSLSETLRDLYELAKPTLLLLALLCLLAFIGLLQFVFIRKRAQENRYVKHQYGSGGSGGSSSGASSALGGSLDCDPVLSSLLGRTLPAPAASSLGQTAKKSYKSYRDHMRKVAAANDLVGNDFIDAAYLANSGQQAPGRQLAAEGYNPLGQSAVQVPNLYHQSLSAREQARSLLQASEHMRSLSNLTAANSNKLPRANQSQGHFQRVCVQNGSHLNLPLSFALGQATGPLEAGAGQLMAGSGAIWAAHLSQPVSRNQQQQQQQQQQNRNDEHYQLVSCSSISPSSSSSALGANSSSALANNLTNGDSKQQLESELLRQEPPKRRSNATNYSQARPQMDSQSSQSNHYSTIETNDEEDRYEELDQSLANEPRRSSSRARRDFSAQQQQSSRTSTFVNATEAANHLKASSRLRSSQMSSNSNSSSSGCGDSTTSSSLIGDAFARFGSKRNSSRPSVKRPTKEGLGQGNNFQDQLSPYAVSAICNNVTPPPVNSEAMRALSEQFDLNQLMLLEDEHPTLPFQPPPPPAQS